MKWTMLCVLGLCVTACAAGARAGGDDGESAKASASADDPKEILKKSEAALQKVKFVRYDGKYKGIGWATEHVPSIEGSVMLGEPSEYDIDRFRCEIKLTPVKSDKTIELTAGSDGDVFYLLDPAVKTVYADMDVAVLGTHSRDLQRILMRPFVAKDPLADELKAEQVALEGTVDVAGEACYEVHVTTSETQEIVWFISTKDWLPRRVDRHYKNPKGEIGTTQLVLSDVAAELTFTPVPFKLKVPEGFTKTDEFAP